MAWVCMAASETGSTVFNDDMTEVTAWILKCTRLYSLLRFSQMLKNRWTVIMVQMDNYPKQTACKKDPRASQDKEIGYWSTATSLALSQPNRACFLYFFLIRNRQRPRINYQLKVGAVKFSKSISRGGGEYSISDIHWF